MRVVRAGDLERRRSYSPRRSDARKIGERYQKTAVRTVTESAVLDPKFTLVGTAWT